MKHWGWPLILALVGVVTGLSMVSVALEKAVIAANDDAPGTRPAAGAYVLLFVGMLLFARCVLLAHTVWSRYLAEHPDTKQIPAAVLAIVGGVAGVVLVVGMVSHAAFVAADPSRQGAVNPGVVAFQVVFATVVVAAAVLGRARRDRSVAPATTRG